MVGMDCAMKKMYFLIAVTVLLSSCVTTQRRVGEGSITAAETVKESKSPSVSKKADGGKEVPKAAGIVVDNKDIAILEKMVKAVESYVLKNDKKNFAALCKDKRFDCYVNDQFYPTRKKKIPRTVPPYALGSKMGLHGENRIHVKYEFYP